MIKNKEKVKKWWGKNQHRLTDESGESEESEIESEKSQTKEAEKHVSFQQQPKIGTQKTT